MSTEAYLDTILLENHYLPSIQFFTKLSRYPKVQIESFEHYVKGSYRNRSHIIGANGIQRLTIPLSKGKNEQMPIKDVRICYDSAWQKQHWRSIKSAYGKSPFYEYYVDDLAPFYHQKYDFLFDLNIGLLHNLVAQIGLETTITQSKDYTFEPFLIADFRNRIHPKKGAVDPNFKPQVYNQVFEERHPFAPNLSILDLLFCVGSETIRILELSTKEKASQGD